MNIIDFAKKIEKLNVEYEQKKMRKVKLMVNWANQILLSVSDLMPYLAGSIADCLCSELIWSGLVISLLLKVFSLSLSFFCLNVSRAVESD